MFVSEFSIWVTGAHQRYLAAKKLLDNAKNDPSSDPYRSKYEARDILTQVELELGKKWKSIDSLQVSLLSMLIKYHLGVIAIETDERSAGCEMLTNILEEIREIATKQEGCHLALNVLNQLGLLWSDRGEVEKALEYLTEAEVIYKEVKATCKGQPYEFEDIFSMENKENEDWVSFEKTFTYSLYYLAQVYEHLHDNEKSATYCRETLKRQRESGDYETNDWALNCATLSHYYIQQNLFPEARHLLSCAAYVLLKYEIKVEEKIEENKDAWTEVHHCKAALSHIWLKYSIHLLAYYAKSDGKVKNREIFSRLIEDEDVLNMEIRIPCTITTYDNARSLFLFAHNHVTVAKSYYALNEYASSYAQITQDHSKLYKNLILFDSDLSRQCKMHKRRMDMLKDLLGKLNPQFYLSICRQLQFELGEISHEMIDLKSKIAHSTHEGLTVNKAKKINSIALKGIHHFQKFIDSFKDKEGKLPDVFSDDVVRPVLIAHFYIGRYYSKLIESDTNKKLHNLSKTEEYYNFIVKYAEQNKQHASFIQQELPVVNEMLELMTEKMNQITCSTMF
ncbi:KIF-binding protein [Nephila pilipes]|uniref:KIF-binding protein n=1 Tax=Nephila pilipes TaxID=299642 RepID=A0A8X6TTU4_NEPPI|nr:KIF-binding protein [Nephila pilipes]